MATKHEFPFSKKRIEALPTPADGRGEYRDSKTPGLVLRVTAKGAKSFNFHGRLNGQRIRMVIGTFPAMTVEQAQQLAKGWQGDLAKGINPQQVRHDARAEPTFAALFAHWMENHAKLKKRTWNLDERLYRIFLKPWADRRLSTIRKPDMASLHSRVGRENGQYAANRLLSLVRAMFNKSEDIGFSGPNPACGIAKFPEVKRERFLKREELKSFFDALAQEPAISRDFFFVALLTGARRSNVQSMRWDEIDFTDAIWRIPADKSKNGKPMDVPLVGYVLELLRLRLQDANGSPFVFPSYGKTGHLADPKFAWKRIIARAALSDIRQHDIRRSMGSWLAITNASLPIIGKMLGHKSPASTAIYARMDLAPVRQAAEKATAAMLQAGGVKLLEVQSESVKTVVHQDS